MEEEKELVPVPVKHHEQKTEKNYIDDTPEQPIPEPHEIPRRWYVY
ncbi:MAG: hypothetical protein JW712_02850 [Dehalococcoidales bacterium]|nr:hypothetical protein [Dehalococcoidales bacterium]